MSFKTALSAVSICNRALSQVPSTAIATMNDTGNSARACRTHYKPTVAGLLEKHSWGLATKRETLAEAVNDRADEWAYAYAKPADLAFPVRIVASSEVSGSSIGYYQGLKHAIQSRGRRMQVIGNRIYTSVAAAKLDYTSFDITEADFTEEFAHVVIAHLIPLLVMQITKDKRYAREKAEEALSMLNSALARAYNQLGDTYGDTPTESELARAGLPIIAVQGSQGVYAW